MKKYIIFSLIVFITYCSNVLCINEKDFCNSGQGYYYDCKEVEIQCNYENFGDKAYLNIKKNGDSAKADEGNGSGKSVQNWGKSENNYTDASIKYKKEGSCPKYLIFENGVPYLSDSQNDAGSGAKVYAYRSYTINSRVKYSVSNNVVVNESAPDVDNCAGFKSENDCENGVTKYSGNFGCAWNEQYEFCSPNGLAYLSCGSEDSIAYDIPVMIPRLASYAITALKTITPVILIIIGMFQLIKAITSQNEDEMKKARSSLIKKLIAAVMIFFLVAIVQFVVKQVADDAEQSSTEACFDCFINNNCTNAMYYTDGYGKCYSVKTNKKLDSCPVAKY